METVMDETLINERIDLVNFISKQLVSLGHEKLTTREVTLIAALMTKLDNKYGW